MFLLVLAMAQGSLVGSESGFLRRVFWEVLFSVARRESSDQCCKAQQVLCTLALQLSGGESVVCRIGYLLWVLVIFRDNGVLDPFVLPLICTVSSSLHLPAKTLPENLMLEGLRPRQYLYTPALNFGFPTPNAGSLDLCAGEASASSPPLSSGGSPDYRGASAGGEWWELRGNSDGDADPGRFPFVLLVFHWQTRAEMVLQ